ncbi:MAG: DinB family protein [Actinomycetota bacterium]|nr:DinB family protein [Actinomycetota bacterium]
MTRDEVLARLVTARAVFDAKVAAAGQDGFDKVPPGFVHSAKDIVVHVTAYERLIVERLRAARKGETTAFDRDREGWEPYNERVWAEAREADEADVIEEARAVFGDLLVEVRALSDAELAGDAGITMVLDPAWLDGRALWEMIGIDGFDHYPMHHETLDAARDAAIEL